MKLKSKIEAIIYAAEEPVSIDHIGALLKESGLLESVLAEVPTDSDAKARAKAERNAIRHALEPVLHELANDYASSDRAMEIKSVAGGYRMATKPEHHDVVRSFAKSLKPPVRLSLQALETLAVIAYKQPVTAPEISEIRGVDSQGVLATLLERKLITTAGRKQVIGRPILYKTTKDFLVRFGLNDIQELPSMEEFEQMTRGAEQEELFASAALPDATGVPDVPESAESSEPAEAAEDHANATSNS